jgi:hypothetical protein
MKMKSVFVPCMALVCAGFLFSGCNNNGQNQVYHTKALTPAEQQAAKDAQIKKINDNPNLTPEQKQQYIGYVNNGGPGGQKGPKK